jgi:hypothetical protein
MKCGGARLLLFPYLPARKHIYYSVVEATPKCRIVIIAFSAVGCDVVVKRKILNIFRAIFKQR